MYCFNWGNMKRLNLLIVIALLFFDFGVSHEQVNRHYERQNYASVEPISMREMCYLVLVKKVNTASSALDALLKAEAYDQLYYVEFDYSSWLESAFSFSYNGYR
jgi:hypothetical protein